MHFHPVLISRLDPFRLMLPHLLLPVLDPILLAHSRVMIASLERVDYVISHRALPSALQSYRLSPYLNVRARQVFLSSNLLCLLWGCDVILGPPRMSMRVADAL